MRKFLSAVLVLVMLVTLMVPAAMAADATPAPAEKSSMNASGGGFTDKLLSAERPEAETEAPKSNIVANVVVFAALVAVAGVSVALIVDKKKKLYK